jgi:hypothetical protein
MLQKQIFLSHRSSQKAWLKEWLVPKLEKAGFDCWLDERAIDALKPITDAAHPPTVGQDKGDFLACITPKNE